MKLSAADLARNALGVALSMVLGLRSETAMGAPTKTECIGSSETAQRLRLEGRLRAARFPFRACSDDACPGPVRDDCREQLIAIDAELPTVHFVARDSVGEVGPLTASMDGELLVDHDSRGGWVVDPGEHVFTLSREGQPTTTRRLIIARGVKGRIETVELEKSRDVDAGNRPNSTPTDLRFVGYGLIGGGVVGLAIGSVFGLLAKSTYDDARNHCPLGQGSCTAAGVEGSATAHHQATVSTIAFVSGAAVAASGVALTIFSLRGSRASVGAGFSGSGFRLYGGW